MNGSSSHRRFAQAAFAAFLIFALPGTALAASAPDCDWNLDGVKQIANTQQFRGKVLYVDFWASWCAPCVLSFPFMNQLQSALGGQGLQVLAVNMDARSEDEQRFLAAHPARFDVASGENAQCAKNFGVAAMPSSFIVDRAGTIRFVHRGFRPDDAGQLRTEVQQLLANKLAQ
ncbi:MAG TPA: TlpA disulfide reductase family protein [Rhizomicrobium sp.]|nr:TlpA disulfide reductase family protein [Rhizomicrobium sp.]